MSSIRFRDMGVSRIVARLISIDVDSTTGVASLTTNVTGEKVQVHLAPGTSISGVHGAHVIGGRTLDDDVQVDIVTDYRDVTIEYNRSVRDSERSAQRESSMAERSWR
jgi:hypothetical protein